MKRGTFPFECSRVLMSAPTAIPHGLLRVLKIGVDVRLTRRADAQPLAGGGFIFIHCPENW